MLARQILEAAERYCAGIGGDPRGQMAPEERWAAYLAQVGEAGRLAAQRDLADAVQVSFAMLAKAHSAGAEDQAGEAIKGGVSRLLAALSHRPEGSDVPDGSNALDFFDEDADGERLADGCAPEPLSGARNQLGLGLSCADDWSDPRERLDQAPAGPGGPGAPRPPLAPPPPHFGVDPQNVEICVVTSGSSGAGS